MDDNGNNINYLHEEILSGNVIMCSLAYYILLKCSLCSDRCNSQRSFSSNVS